MEKSKYRGNEKLWKKMEKNYLYKGHIDEKLLRFLLDFLPFL